MAPGRYYLPGSTCPRGQASLQGGKVKKFLVLQDINRLLIALRFGVYLGKKRAMFSECRYDYLAEVIKIDGKTRDFSNVVGDQGYFDIFERSWAPPVCMTSS